LEVTRSFGSTRATIPNGSRSTCGTLEGVTGTALLGETVQLTVRGTSSLLPLVIQAAEAGGFQVRDISIDEPSLETVFINLTGKDLRE
jgi:ABC-2 type transport system ATP-binding protein